MLRKTWERTLRMADGPHALWGLAFVAFVESSVFPIPPDALMIPMMLACPARAWLIAGVATVASVLGGLLGYFIGAVLFDGLGQPILEFYGQSHRFSDFAERYNTWGAWAVLIAGLTPFPYKVVTILSGVTGLSLPVFIASSIIARGIRFFLLAALLWRFGPPARRIVENRPWFVTGLFVLALLGGFYLMRYL